MGTTARGNDTPDVRRTPCSGFVQQCLFTDMGPWIPTLDCDPRAFAIYTRHYSFRDYADGRRRNTSNPARFQFVGPGEKLVLVTINYDALFAWRKFIDDSGQKGVNCAVFRNESEQRASDLILAAEEIAWLKWPHERLYTYVNEAKLPGNCPGYCFIRAGWKRLKEKTKSGLLIFEKYPS